MVLAGGRGERLWPLSRAAQPKPFLRFGDRKSLLGATLDRAGALAPRGRIRIVAGESLIGSIRKDLGKAWVLRTLREPAARNTGGACLLAAHWLQRRDPQATMLMLPSDHRISGAAAFRRAVARARRLAERGFLVTFGIPPAGPSEELGYLVPGPPLGREGRRVTRFVEKPPQRRARGLLRRGALWNSGMFCWRADVFLEEASRAEPAYGRWLRRSGTAAQATTANGFARLPSLPVDRAVLERSRRVAVVPARFTWSDVGSWEQLPPPVRKDRQGNVVRGEVLAIRSRGNLVHREAGRCVLWGVDHLALLQSGDTLLLCPRDRLSRLRDLLAELRRRDWRHGD
jgi:mannose-1-phosphate guanylyltransferase/mannose-6-phosphate isomerase